MSKYIATTGERFDGLQIRLASPANVWGKALGDVKQLRQVAPGTAIRVESA